MRVQREDTLNMHSVSTMEYPETTVRTPAFSRPDGAKEVEILLACARLRLEERDVERIRSLLIQEPDWERLLLLAVFHRLAGFVAQSLGKAAPDLVPAPTLEALRARFVQDGAAALRQTGELLELLTLLGDAGIFAIPYKGPILAAQVYGNIAYRRCMDLDVLIGRQDVPRARDLLQKAGFQPRHPLSAAGREFLLNHRHSEIFERTGGPLLELHWAFAKQRGMFALTMDELRSRLEGIKVGGVSVPVLRHDDLLMVLCVHGANHLWSRLEWLTSVAELLRKQTLDWTQALERASALHVEKYVLLGTLLSNDLLGVPIPADVLERARSDRNIVRLASIVGQKLAAADIENAEKLNSVPRDLFRLRLQSTMGDRWKYVLHRLTTPRREDTRLMVPVGKGNIPLPALTRPFHVIWILVTGMFRQSNSTDRRSGENR